MLDPLILTHASVRSEQRTLLLRLESVAQGRLHMWAADRVRVGSKATIQLSRMAAPAGSLPGEGGGAGPPTSKLESQGEQPCTVDVRGRVVASAARPGGGCAVIVAPTVASSSSGSFCLRQLVADLLAIDWDGANVRLEPGGARYVFPHATHPPVTGDLRRGTVRISSEKHLVESRVPVSYGWAAELRLTRRGEAASISESTMYLHASDSVLPEAGEAIRISYPLERSARLAEVVLRGRVVQHLRGHLGKPHGFVVELDLEPGAGSTAAWLAHVEAARHDARRRTLRHAS